MALYFLDSSAIVKPPDVLFVSADLGLLAIARAEGLRSENPNTYA